VDFIPKAAMYISERIWSRDQKITRHKDGSITLTFTATSRPEVIAWILSFGGEATLCEPKEIQILISARAKRTHERHRL